MIFSAFFFYMYSTIVYAQTTVSPWAVGSNLDALRMNAELSNERRDYADLIAEAHKFAQLNAADQAQNGGLRDSVSGEAPHVVITQMPSYYCGLPIADLVHHSVVWTPAVIGITQFLKKYPPGSLTHYEKRAIAKIIVVAMNGLNFFVRRDLISINLTSSAFNFKVPEPCDKMARLNGVVAPLNYNTAAGHLAFELGNFFSLPGARISNVSSQLGKNQITYLEKMRVLSTKLKNYSLSQIREDRNGAAFWSYIPGGRSEDNTHAYITIGWLTRLRHFKEIPASIIYGFIKAFKRQYSRGPRSTYAYFDPTYASGSRGTLYATTGLLFWSDLIIYDCNLTKYFEELLETPVQKLSAPFTPVANTDRIFAKPSTNEYVALRVHYGRRNCPEN